MYLAKLFLLLTESWALVVTRKIYTPAASPIPPVLPTNTTYDSQSRHSSLVVVTVTVTVSALLVTGK